MTRRPSAGHEKKQSALAGLNFIKALLCPLKHTPMFFVASWHFGPYKGTNCFLGIWCLFPYGLGAHKRENRLFFSCLAYFPTGYPQFLATCFQLIGRRPDPSNTHRTKLQIEAPDVRIDRTHERGFQFGEQRTLIVSSGPAIRSIGSGTASSRLVWNRGARRLTPACGLVRESAGRYALDKRGSATDRGRRDASGRANADD